MNASTRSTVRASAKGPRRSGPAINLPIRAVHSRKQKLNAGPGAEHLRTGSEAQAHAYAR